MPGLISTSIRIEVEINPARGVRIPGERNNSVRPGSPECPSGEVKKLQVQDFLGLSQNFDDLISTSIRIEVEINPARGVRIPGERNNSVRPGSPECPSGEVKKLQVQDFLGLSQNFDDLISTSIRIEVEINPAWDVPRPGQELRATGADWATESPRSLHFCDETRPGEHS